jgi:hypothetical protein
VFAIAFVAALQGQAPDPSPPWYGRTGRVYTSPVLHVGVRPAVHLEVGEADVGLTVQVTTFALQ